MKKLKITFRSQKIIAVISPGDSILDAIREANLHINLPCGGKGICGKCTFKLLSGTLNTKPFKNEAIYLACTSKPLSDCEIELISELEINILNNDNKHLSNLNISKELSGTNKKNITVPEGFDQKELNDLINQNINQEYSITVEEIAWLLKNPIDSITITTDQNNNIIHVEEGNTTKQSYGLAIDLGTTTIDILLVNLNTGDIISNNSIYNPQSKFGADIISRIVYIEKYNALKELQQIAIDSINRVIKEILNIYTIRRENIYQVVISGNTTMSHIISGNDPSDVRNKDYHVLFNNITTLNNEDIVILANRNANMSLLPCISNYIGGDIIAGILSTQIHKSNGINLLIDLGTNGEIVLGNSEWLISCSCSAGPAFEGANISCGTRAISGAIDYIYINEKTLEVDYKTINNSEPIGICGTAVIDLIASMITAKIIDKQGKINRNLKHPRIRQKGAIYEYVIIYKDKSKTGEDITFNEIDIQNVIRAKAAIFAGMTTLIKSVGIDYNEVDKIYIAGTLGKYINFRNAVKIGLLPDVNMAKFEYFGNTSLMGSYIYLNNATLKDEISTMAKNITYLNLSDITDYMSFYVASHFIPHTNLELFPSFDS